MTFLITILSGDCRSVLPTLAAQSVQCCVTSPPYWGLRDYGTGSWEGGEPGCDHKVDSQSAAMKQKRSTLGPNRDGLTADNAAFKAIDEVYRSECGKCGARRVDLQIGLEATPQAYVETLRQVFREVWRVLKDDGTVWLNLGDSYSRQGGATDNKNTARELAHMEGTQKRAMNKPAEGFKPKDLVGIPWRVAFALQADGWYLRQDIIWHKPNPMPESVTDRCTKSHEYIFLLTKRERYYYNHEAIKEPMESERPDMATKGVRTGLAYLQQGTPSNSVKSRKAYKPTEGGGGTSFNGHSGNYKSNGEPICDGTRNKRDVWTVTTAPYAEAHFATFPPDLIKPCILAGTKPGDVVLDPFGGSGTTGMVALELGRRAVLIELNPAYAKLCDDRCNVTTGLAL